MRYYGNERKTREKILLKVKFSKKGLITSIELIRQKKTIDRRNFLIEIEG